MKLGLVRSLWGVVSGNRAKPRTAVFVLSLLFCPWKLTFNVYTRSG